MKNDKKAKDIEKVVVKARYWSFIVYPESAPADWIEKLQMTGLPFVVSPLHDKDINPTGEEKKPHWHVIIAYNGPTTFSNVKKNITDILNAPHPQYLQSVKGMYRYLTHKDNPEKYQYDDNDIKAYGGFNINDYAELSITDEDRCYTAIEEIIFNAKIIEYWELCLFLRENGMTELLSFVRRHTYHFKELITSLRHSNYFERQEQQEQQANGLNDDHCDE